MQGFPQTTAALEAVVARCAAAGDRNGYFPALYLAVTRTVRERCDRQEFEDAARMERFVCRFAARYLDAEAGFQRGEQVTSSWQAAFDAGRTWRPVVVQHLLLGINAHINLDLGVTTAEAGVGGDRTGALEAMRVDFDAVNDVLAELVDGCQAALAEVSPWVGLADRVGGGGDEAMVNFSLRKAREHAWAVAVLLAPLDGDTLAAAVADVDRSTAELARLVRRPGYLGSVLLLVVRLRERASPSRVMQLLAAVSTG